MTDLALIGLGPYRFATNRLSFQKLGRKFAFRWEAVNRVGIRPAMQFMGPGEESISIDGVIYPHYCLAQSERILTADMQWVPCGDLKTGDAIIAFDEEYRPGRKHRRWKWARITHSQPAKKECVRIHLDNDEAVVCTTDHPWLAGIPTSDREIRRRMWVRADKLIAPPSTNRRENVGMAVCKPFDVWQRAETHDAGWMGGLYDGEGSVSGAKRGGITLCVAQRPGPVLDKAKRILADHGFRFCEYTNVRSDVRTLELCGGFSELLRALGTFQPIRLISRLQAMDLGDYVSTKSFDAAKGIARVVEIEPLGMREIQSISTDASTYVGAGYMMHNTGGFGQLMRMRESAANGDSFDMASGAGTNLGIYHGEWVIRAIEDVQSYFHKSGAPLKIEFKIELVHYGG